MRTLFFTALGAITAALLVPELLNWFIELTREPAVRCDGGEGQTKE